MRNSIVVRVAFVLVMVCPSAWTQELAEANSFTPYIAQINIDTKSKGAIDEVASLVRTEAARIASDYGLKLLYVYDYVYHGFVFLQGDDKKASEIKRELGRRLKDFHPSGNEVIVDQTGGNSLAEFQDWLRNSIAPRRANDTPARVWVLDSGLLKRSPSAGPKLYNVDEDLSGSFLYGSSDRSSVDYQHPSRGYQDNYGHGTLVASIIGADSENLPGLARGVRMGILKVTKDGVGKDFDLIAAINYVAMTNFKSRAQKLRDIVNISSCSNKKNNDVDTAVLDLSRQGVRVVVAAGNNGQNAESYSPAGLKSSNVFVIGSCDRDYSLSHNSNYGESVRFVEPGVDVYSLDTSGSRKAVSGTSFACPVFSSLLVFKDPPLNPEMTEIPVPTPGGISSLWLGH